MDRNEADVSTALAFILRHLRSGDPCSMTEIRKSFNGDQIQLLVSRYSSEAFTVDVQFIERDGQEHPVIIVPSGARIPVAIQSDLLDQVANKAALRAGEVPFRTLVSSRKVSTSAARPADWKDICFESREADIGRFLRRHLGGADITSILASLGIPRLNRRPHTIDIKSFARAVPIIWTASRTGLANLAWRPRNHTCCE